MKVAILGTGVYALALANSINKNYEIHMWTKFKEEKELLEQSSDVKDIPVPKHVNISNNLEEVVKNSKVIIIAIPAKFFEENIKLLAKYVNSKQHICIATKGISQNNNLFMNQIVEKYIKTKNISAISGPSFAIDIVNKLPIGLTFASRNKKHFETLKQIFKGSNIKLTYTRDIIGAELCGSIKNIIAIACGILDGMDANESTKAMFLTEAVNDIKNLIFLLGGTKKTILSYAGIGDLVLTCTSTKSRNFTLGNLIGKNKSKEIIDEYIKTTTIEGLYTLESIKKLIIKKGLKIPIITLIYNIIYNKENPNKLLEFLLIKKELE